MFNPPSFNQNSGSYVDLMKRITQSMHEKKVVDQVFEIINKTYEIALDEENIILSRHERTRLLLQVTRAILAEMLKKIDDTSG